MLSGALEAVVGHGLARLLRSDDGIKRVLLSRALSSRVPYLVKVVAELSRTRLIDDKRDGDSTNRPVRLCGRKRWPAPVSCRGCMMMEKLLRLYLCDRIGHDIVPGLRS